MAVFDDRDPSHYQYMQTTSLTSYAGAAASLALVVGISIWGYQLIMRDVSGIPVVRAAEGAMRVAPQDAGGEIADHAGLAVNEVAGVGEAAGPSDSLLLAPQTPGLAAEDLRVEPLAEAEDVAAAASVVPAPLEQEVPAVIDLTVPGEAEAEPLTTEGLLALADQIAGAEPPLTALAEGEDVAPTVALDGEVVAGPQVIDASVPGVAVSLRPAVRPASLVTVSATAEAPVQVVDTSTAVAAALAEAQLAVSAPLPAGTNLVQLGAYPTEEAATQDWNRISAQFATFMADKERVIQEATSGGSVFYRLRASGFVDATSARRFCETLKAGQAECIPVVLR